MATAFDFILVDQISTILVLIFVFALVYGGFTYGKMFNPAINAILAIVIALLMLVMPKLIEVIKIALPWFTSVIILTLLLLLVARMFGSEDSDIKRVFANEEIMYWFITAAILILLFAVGKVYFGSGKFLEEGGSAVDAIKEGAAGSESAGEISFWNTLFHPNVLGFILIMMIAMFTIILLGGRPMGGGNSGGHGGGGHH
ncbi:hypothetical protein J4206_04825 [Candidatus Woesearchaeota archaeon]|nr:hypothetical protein [Candidatus Woesearchaeota archaeon]